MTKIKICGLLDGEDVAHGVGSADFLGLNFWPRSKRFASLDVAEAVAAAVRAGSAAQLVGLFVNQPAEDIARIHAAIALDVIQLHGDETPDDVALVARTTGLPVWKAIAIGSAADLDALDRWPADALLLDAPSAGRGGAGVTFDWALAAEANRRYPERRFVLAGGLTPDNVGAAIAAVRPWAVDVASGVERAPGRKDPGKARAFVSAVRGG
jgi:phosphoribosylanthranilate isomerase